jgi:hypothetical protein
VASKPYRVTVQYPTFNQLVYGDPDAGKTTYCATAQDHPEMADCLIANIEGGLLSIAHRGDIHAEDIHSADELETLAWRIAQNEFPTVNTLAVDNITELQTLDLQQTVLEAIKGGRNRVKNRARTVDDVWQEDYLKSTNRLLRLFRMLRDLPINVIFTAHLKRVYPKVAEGTDMNTIDPVAIVPALSQKLMMSTMGMMDFVWCLEKDENGVPFAVTTSKGEYRCKTRGPRFLKAIGDVVENPTLPELYDTFVRTAHRKKRKV